MPDQAFFSLTCLFPFPRLLLSLLLLAAQPLLHLSLPLSTHFCPSLKHTHTLLIVGFNGRGRFWRFLARRTDGRGHIASLSTGSLERFFCFVLSSSSFFFACFLVFIYLPAYDLPAFFITHACQPGHGWTDGTKKRGLERDFLMLFVCCCFAASAAASLLHAGIFFFSAEQQPSPAFVD